jgi:hypothetical protein
MSDPESFDIDDYPDDTAIAQEEVASAARSCSAILIIGLALVLILCLALSASYLF